MRIIGWAMPLLCMVLASGAIYTQYTRGKAAQKADTAVMAQLDAQEKLLADFKKQPSPDVILAADPLPQEQTEFVERLKELASHTGVKIQKLTNTKSATPVNADTLKDVVAINSDLEASGDYFQVREFVSGITRGPRLMVLTKATWKTDEGATGISVTITRYVRATSG
jgi:hypothetical protein